MAAAGSPFSSVLCLPFSLSFRDMESDASVPERHHYDQPIQPGALFGKSPNGSGRAVVVWKTNAERSECFRIVAK